MQTLDDSKRLVIDKFIKNDKDLFEPPEDENSGFHKYGKLILAPSLDTKEKARDYALVSYWQRDSENK